MSDFLDLPVELLPCILKHVLKPQHLAACCRVNKTFHTFTSPLLYERVTIYAWHPKGKFNVIRVFRTLAESPALARYVLRLGERHSKETESIDDTRKENYLDIRDFPKAMSDGDDPFSVCVAGLRNCVNLRSCTWTRDGSLNDIILETLQECSSLHTLEINGNHEGHYHPPLLTRFDRLHKITLIMPSGPVINALPQWVGNTSRTLRSLTLICKATSIVTDGLLQAVAPELGQLEHLHLIGCRKVTERGVWSIVDSSRVGITGLGLEDVSPKFDMVIFAQLCSKANVLAKLNAITVTIQPQTSLALWSESLFKLISTCPLQVFQIYSPGGSYQAFMPDNFVHGIVTAHGSHLTRFSVHRMHMSLAAIDDICRRCVNLQQLFVVAERSDLEVVGSSLSRARNLRTVHINYPLEGSTDTAPVLLREDIVTLIRSYGLTVKEFGCNTRVWQVQRTVAHIDGEKIIEVQLSLLESPEIPEQFLVVRA